MNKRKEAPCLVRFWALWLPWSILQVSLDVAPVLPGLLKGPQSVCCESAEPHASCLPGRAVWGVLQSALGSVLLFTPPPEHLRTRKVPPEILEASESVPALSWAVPFFWPLFPHLC